MAALTGLGKGLDFCGEMGSVLLSGDITANFAAPAAAQNVLIYVPVDMQILGWFVVMLASGSIVFDVWRTSIVNTEVNGVFTPPTIPVVGNSIAGTYKPTLTSGTIAIGGSIPGYPPNALSMFELGWGGSGVAAKAGLTLYAGDLLIFDVVSYTAGGAATVGLVCQTGS